MNMSYCRYRNTLNAMTDCANDLEERCNGDAADMLDHEEFEAACQLALQAQRLINLIRKTGTFDTDQDLTSDQIHDAIAAIDEDACEQRKIEEGYSNMEQA